MDAMVEKKKIQRELLVQLEGKELAEKSAALAALVSEQNRIETEVTGYTAPRRKRMREIRKEQRRFADEIEKGMGVAMVDCEEQYDYRTGTCKIVRNDTGETIETRAITAEERQTSVPSVDADEGGAKRRLGKRGAAASEAH